MKHEQMKAEKALEDQTNILPASRVLIVFAAMSCSLLVSYIDQSALGEMLPAIGEDLNAETTVSWASTSTMIGNTTFQVLYGRLSDIFGRKYIFLSALLVFFISDLCCGFAQTPAQLYVFRGFSGIASGGINALTMIIISDIVTLQQRGKYQGILGSTIGTANTVGPFIAAALIDHSSWRTLFYIIGPLGLGALIVAYFIIPLKLSSGHYVEKLKQVDFLGILVSSISVIFLLIPITSGGTTWAWNSGFVIAFFCIGVLALVVFIYIEARIAKLPMIPLQLFKSKIRSAMFIQIFCSGAVYYVQVSFLPVYYQNARGYSKIFSAIMLLPMVMPQAFASSLAGIFISKTGRYAIVIWVGYLFLTIATSVQLAIFNDHTRSGFLAIPLIIQSIGIAFTFQPSLIALQANSSKANRAVIISVRNVVRSMGAAVGLAIASALLSNVLLGNIPDDVPDYTKRQMAESVYAVPDLSGLSASQVRSVRKAYATAHRAIFAYMVPMMAISLLLCVFVKETGLERKEEKEAAAAAAAAEAAAITAGTEALNEEQVQTTMEKSNGEEDITDINTVEDSESMEKIEDIEAQREKY
ncbi:major facilitator superfamily domain-containing protein [Lipomyces oligophaga]|uniref:major facilitator superfamily domain-containing protein n=1 Tax=Lipomyces oligophaga TaxID=45792 RepID=UPI0034CD702E